jgi:hypothetical protein
LSATWSAILVLGGVCAGLAPGPSGVSGAEPSLRALNLKVLSRDTSAAELKRVMDGYGTQLGVSCGYCHVENPQTQQLDYASDDNPAKQTARLMITMLNDINGKYLAQLGEDRYAVRVTCGNCHQGHADPPAFDADGHM